MMEVPVPFLPMVPALQVFPLSGQPVHIISGPSNQVIAGQSNQGDVSPTKLPDLVCFKLERKLYFFFLNLLF